MLILKEERCEILMSKCYFPTDQWNAQNAGQLNMDESVLMRLNTAIPKHYGNINGIVVLRDGYIAYENYFNDCGSTDPHHVASATKSVLSALIGIAIEAGYIKSADEKVMDFFPEYPAGNGQQGITIHNLLTMTVPYDFDAEPFEKLCGSQNWANCALVMMGKNGRVGDFKYSTTGAHLLSIILTRSTGRSARDFANEFLFSPIGMREIPDYQMAGYGYEDLFGGLVKGWVKDPQGNSTGGWGLTLTPRDMARFGLLYLNGGLWDGRPIVSQRWIQKSLMAHTKGYGYLWWLLDDAYAAIGDGGNIICCIPNQQMVVAIASQFMMNAPDRWTFIKEYIVPAVKD
jgi:CubicO group peptidase (beta-lactamase class C family)